MDDDVLPMFPLGSVLFPSMVLPLHVFEPRYRQLVDACLAGSSEFGVVLIQRGSEVGGHDVRTDVGTVARIAQAARLDDGRWALGTVGTRRVRVVDWLPDDPYPRAEVADWPDPEPATDLTAGYRERVQSLRRVLALTAEVGDPGAPATVELTDEPVLGSYQICALAPFGPLDQQRLLAAESVEARLDEVGRMLDEEAGFLAQRLALG
jgi:Lon protease-like protein